MALRSTPTVLILSLALCAACDKEEPPSEARVDTRPAPPPAPPAPPAEPRAPDIIVDHAKVSIGTDRVATEDLGLADKVAVFVTGRPGVEGRSVDLVAMRDAKASKVAAVVTALRRARASGANVKTDTRDGTTQSVPLTFAASVQDCTTVAWIAKDDAIDVWPAGGAKAKRVTKGLAGPDVTLGTEAVRAQQSSCGASELVVGADDSIQWGLVFDLATTALHMPGARASAMLLVTSAVPGRKLELAP